MTKRFFSTTGLSIQAWDPSISPGSVYQPLGTLVSDALHYHVEGYQHKLGSLGGFLTARLELRLPALNAEDWFTAGLGRHIVVYNSGMDIVWAGFVNRIGLGMGALSAERGPLLDVANRASVMYAPILDDSVSPPIIGTTIPTTIVEDTSSQADYGVLEKVLSGGTCTDEDAERYRDTFLEENKYPVTSESLNLSPGDAKEPQISLECEGYHRWFEVYPYEDATTGSTSVHDKIENVITADPNGLFSTDYGDIAANAYLTPEQEQDMPTAWAVLKSLVALGDASDKRYSFGIYADQKARYRAIEDLDELYNHRLTSEGQQVTLKKDQSVVFPWDVRADEWMFLPDFLPGRTVYSERRRDPRYIYIESVTYTAPYGLAVNGQHISTLPQLLAKAGLGGMA